VSALLATLLFPSWAWGDSSFLKQGIEEYQAGKYEDAAGHLGAALSTDFNDARLHYYLGNAYLHMKQRDGAIREFRIAFALEPEAQVGRYAKQALTMLGVDVASKGGSADLSAMFVIPPPPKPPTQPTQTPDQLADVMAKLLSTYMANIFNPPAGGAEHSPLLQSLATEWRAGEKLDDSKLPANNGDGPWFRVPVWLAGTWSQATSRVQSLSEDLREKGHITTELPVTLSTRPERWGEVRDKQGDFWEHPCVPNVVRENGANNSTTVDVSVKMQPVEASTARVTLYYRWLSFRLGSDHVIRSASQCELISSYTPISSGYIQKTESLKQFDQLGVPIELAKYRSYYKLTKPAEPVLHDASGHELITLFRKYLTDSKLLNLMP
jgi:hypothetical protein